MVFESVVARLLNSFLGDFVDNLDSSQLNIGIWEGNVKLHNLEIKESALDSLDLPIKLKFGYLNTFIMKIPWNILYTEPVIVDIEGLHIIIVPNQGVVYNEEKARKNEKRTKQRELNALEENRKAKRKVKEDINDTFTEKLVSQVIKNLQVNIKNIHIRYEDKHSNWQRPFAAGITLENLEFQTTDSNFKAKIHKEEMKIFYKLFSLNSLAIYWNSNSKLISDLESKRDILAALNATIATKHSQPEYYKYVFGPIPMTAKLYLNQKPEVNKFKIPKVYLNIETEELSLCIGKHQYQDMLNFLEAQERFNLTQRHLKYRPNFTTYRGHYKEWYKFCYDCIVADICRKHQNWLWENMKKHREMLKAYREAWVHFRTEKDLSAVHKKTIEEIEEKLDTFNLNIARQQADMDIDRLKLIRTEDQEVQTWGSWAASWFGGRALTTQTCEPIGHEIVSQFEEAMTPDEKAKLFDAIDYQENIPPTNYPKEFVENKISVKVLSVTIAVDSIIQLSFNDLTTDLERRSSARATHLKCSIKAVSMMGLGHSMLTMLVPEEHWLNAEYITNPLDGSFDQFVGLTTAPVLLKYHAPAINAFFGVFQPPRSVRLNQLATAAFARYEAAKFSSLTGLQYAVEKNPRLKLEIHFAPTKIVLSKGGSFKEDTLNLIAQLGSLDVRTIEEITNFNFGEDVKDQKHKSVLSKAYMKIQIIMSDIQFCFADNYRKCIHSLRDVNSPYHIVKPMRVELNLCRAMIDDYQIPRSRLYGKLPNVRVSISDERLTSLLELLLSIPYETGADEEYVDDSESVNNVPTLFASEIRKRAKLLAMLENSADLNTTNMSETENKKLLEDDLQGTADPKMFIFEFMIDEISALLFSKKLQKSKDTFTSSIPPFGTLNVGNIRVNGHMTERGYLQCRLNLRTITMDDKREGTIIQRLLDKKSLNNSYDMGTSADDSFLCLFYEHNHKGEKKVNVSSSSFYLLLSPEFLDALSSFVVVPKMEDVDLELNSASTIHNNRARTITQSTNISSIMTPEKANRKKIDASVASLTMNFQFQQIDIILIEEHHQPSNHSQPNVSFNTYSTANNENDSLCLFSSSNTADISNSNACSSSASSQNVSLKVEIPQLTLELRRRYPPLGCQIFARDNSSIDGTSIPFTLAKVTDVHLQMSNLMAADCVSTLTFQLSASWMDDRHVALPFLRFTMNDVCLEQCGDHLDATMTLGIDYFNEFNFGYEPLVEAWRVEKLFVQWCENHLNVDILPGENSTLNINLTQTFIRQARRFANRPWVPYMHEWTIEVAAPLMPTCSPTYNYNVTLYIPSGIGISCINAHDEELFYLQFCGVKVHFLKRETTYQFITHVDVVQADNQLLNTERWQFLYCDPKLFLTEEWTPDEVDYQYAPPKATAGGAQQNRRTNSSLSNGTANGNNVANTPPALSIEFSYMPTKQYDVFENMHIRLADLSIFLDEMLLWKLIEMITDVSNSTATASTLKKTLSIVDESTLADDVLQSMLSNSNEDPTAANSGRYSQREDPSQSAHKCFLESFELQLGNVTLSALAASDSALPDELRALKRRFDITLVSFENALVHVSPFRKCHYFGTIDMLLSAMGDFYLSELRKHKLNIIVTMDAFGNPMGFASDLRESIEGLIFDGDVGGFMFGLSYGVTNSISKVASSWSQGVGFLTFDEQHEQLRRQMLRNGPSAENSTVLSHLYDGVKGLGMGIFGGVTAIAKNTYFATQKDGIAGLLRGVTTGAFDTVTKPLQGALDLLEGTASAFKEAVGSPSSARKQFAKKRLRLPRVCTSLQSRLQPYSRQLAEAQQVLLRINSYNTTERLFDALIYYAESPKLGTRVEFCAIVCLEQFYVVRRVNDEPWTVVQRIAYSYLRSVQPTRIPKTMPTGIVPLEIIYVPQKQKRMPKFKAPQQLWCSSPEIAAQLSRKIMSAKDSHDRLMHKCKRTVPTTAAGTLMSSLKSSQHDESPAAKKTPPLMLFAQMPSAKSPPPKEMSYGRLMFTSARPSGGASSSTPAKPTMPPAIPLYLRSVSFTAPQLVQSSSSSLLSSGCYVGKKDRRQRQTLSSPKSDTLIIDEELPSSPNEDSSLLFDYR